MIGCGDVTQVKSGPAFNKVDNSFIAAVMSRDIAKARKYAAENNIESYYDDVHLLLANPQVNAIYIATPPSSHEAYALLAIEAGKDVYIEKPIAMNDASAQKMKEAADAAGVKSVVAHYRREQPIFKKIKELIDSKVIGKVRLATCNYQKIKQTEAELKIPGNAWRVNPAISGGGIFHDLAPHQLDLMLHFFGSFRSAAGYSKNQSGMHEADDIVAGAILFDNDVIFSGSWLFNGSENVDQIEIIGEKGKISFGNFQHEKLQLTFDGRSQTLTFEHLPHVQMPLIAEVVKYFRNERDNPCELQNGVDVMKIIDAFTKNN